MTAVEIQLHTSLRPQILWTVAGVGGSSLLSRLSRGISIVEQTRIS